MRTYHDIQNKPTIISGAVEVLSEKINDPEHHKWLSMIMNSMSDLVPLMGILFGKLKEKEPKDV